MQQPIKLLTRKFEQVIPDPLINRNQMIAYAKTLNIRVTMSTIHRWANEADFPLVKGLDGRNLLYSKGEFEVFLRRKIKRIQEER